MKIGFKVQGNEGEFQYPHETYHKFTDALGTALDQRNYGELSTPAYIATLKKLLKEEPDFIDGYAHLGLALLEQGKTNKALEACLMGVSVGEKALPKNYAGQAPWYCLDNRPFLRALHGAICCTIRLRRRKIAVEQIETLLRYNPDDNQGVRYLLGSEYLRLGKMQPAREILEQEAPHYPPCQYDLALLYLERGNMITAATSLRRGFLANPYIAEILCGNPNPIPLVISHGSNYAEPEIARDYVEMYGDYWQRRPDCIHILHWILNHPKVMRERAEYQALRAELLWAQEPEARRAIVERISAIEREIDDTLSKEIVAHRADETGQTIAPWINPKRSMMRI
ncbi:hypothetical protein [Paremcibacter congregatus]|uniref:tetratricopeptide repeat protein n=1 Tax=Paremcibacter congregatus TaxID=2043170 RepID=UPI0030EBE867